MDCDENHVILDGQSVLDIHSIVRKSDPFIVDMSVDQMYFAMEDLMGIAELKPLKGKGGNFICTIVDKKKWMLAKLKFEL